MFKTQTVVIRLPMTVFRKIQPLAEKKGLTPSAYCKVIICENMTQKN